MTERGVLGNAKPVVIICTRDRTKAVPFYRDSLGLTQVSQDQFAVVFALPGALMRLSDVANWTPHEHTIFGFEVPNIKASVRALAANGVEFIRYPGFTQDSDGVWEAPDGGAKVAWFKDPDGNNLSIAEFVSK
jgi:catechol 2,3-dioxygenase-like lactoylglutathione lyase family enzyme